MGEIREEEMRLCDDDWVVGKRRKMSDGLRGGGNGESYL